MQIRCGSCIGCLLDDSRDWASRGMHEAKQHFHNCFLTATFDEEHHPKSISLDHRYWQLFIKKLREASQRQLSRALANGHYEQSYTGRVRLPNTTDYPIQVAYEARDGRHEHRAVVRYHMCGEYGPTTGRQHYHANMFGVNFQDRKPYKKSESGNQLYTSKTLDEIWGNGRITIGMLTWQTVAYTSRYNLKKAGDKNKKEIEIIDIETGEVIKRAAEYQKMSRNPGIGKDWLKQHTSDVYPHGTIIVAGQEVKPPRFYDEYYRQLDKEGYEQLKIRRQQEQAKREGDGLTRSRLDAKETVHKAKIAFLKRNGDEQ